MLPHPDPIKKSLLVFVKASQVDSGSGVAEIVNKYFSRASKGLALYSSKSDIVEQINTLAPQCQNKGKLAHQPPLCMTPTQLSTECPDSWDHTIRTSPSPLILLDFRSFENLDSTCFVKALTHLESNTNPTVYSCIVIEGGITSANTAQYLDYWKSSVPQELQSFLPKQSHTFIDDHPVDIDPATSSLAVIADRIGQTARVSLSFANLGHPTVEEIAHSESKIIPLKALLRQAGYVAGSFAKYGS